VRPSLVLFVGLFALLSSSCDCDDSGSPAQDAGPDGAGDAGPVPGRAVRVPDMVEADVGAVVHVGVTIVAGSAPWTAQLLAEAPPFVYLDGQPVDVSPLSFDAVSLEAGQQKEYSLRLQTLLTWDHTFTVWVEGQSYEVPVHPRVRAPLIGLDGLGCDGPHELAFGPDCGPCGIETTSAVCAASQELANCHPVGFRLPDGGDEASRARCNAGAAVPSQTTRQVPSSFMDLATSASLLDLTELEWISGVRQEQLRTRPILTPGLDSWWMTSCPACANADGSHGAYDPANLTVFGGLETMSREIGGVPGVAAVLIADETATMEHLCPCIEAGTPCEAASGPDQPACAAPDALYTEELGTTYGPLMAAIGTRMGRGVDAAGTEALVVSAPIDAPNRGLTPLTRTALEEGLSTFIDALGIVSAPMPVPTWLDPVPDCSTAEPGCDTAPPFEDWTALLPPEGGGDPVATVVSATRTWRTFDADVDPAEILRALSIAGWPDLPLWVTSVRGGFHGTTPREVVAGLRAATILTSAGVAGISFAFPPTNSDAFELLVRSLSGAHPVERAETTEGYDDVVLRFLSKDGQDVLVAWNNAEGPRVVFLDAEDLEYTAVTVTRVHASAEEAQITTEAFDTPDVQLDLPSLTDIVIVTVDAARSQDLEFDWLASIQQ
jgi:hypothetical protein